MSIGVKLHLRFIDSVSRLAFITQENILYGPVAIRELKYNFGNKSISIMYFSGQLKCFLVLT